MFSLLKFFREITMDLVRFLFVITVAYYVLWSTTQGTPQVFKPFGSFFLVLHDFLFAYPKFAYLCFVVSFGVILCFEYRRIAPAPSCVELLSFFNFSTHPLIGVAYPLNVYECKSCRVVVLAYSDLQSVRDKIVLTRKINKILFKHIHLECDFVHPCPGNNLELMGPY